MIYGDNIELLGLFGLTVNEKVAKYIFDITGNGKLKSFFGPGGWNTGLINRLDDNLKSLKAKGYSDNELSVHLSSALNLPSNVVEAYLESFQTVDRTTAVQKAGAAAKAAKGPLTGILIVAGLAAGAIILMQLSPLLKTMTPKRG